VLRSPDSRGCRRLPSRSLGGRPKRCTRTGAGRALARGAPGWPLMCPWWQTTLPSDSHSASSGLACARNAPAAACHRRSCSMLQAGARPRPASDRRPEAACALTTHIGSALLNGTAGSAPRCDPSQAGAMRHSWSRVRMQCPQEGPRALCACLFIRSRHATRAGHAPCAHMPPAPCTCVCLWLRQCQ